MTSSITNPRTKIKVFVLATLSLILLVKILNYNTYLPFSFSHQSDFDWAAPSHWNITPKINNNTCFVKRVAFIKVHKAASTTVTSIIQRFGLSHNLTFALPKVDNYHIGLFETFNPERVSPIKEGAVYEILCQHVVYNREAFRKYMPPDMKIIASVRQPLKKFVSAFMFFRYGQSVRIKSHKSMSSVDSMKEFLKRPDFYEVDEFKRGSLAYNRMAYDLGIPKIQFNNKSYVQDYIQLLDEDMSFVIVAEFFDHSLVLLKRKFCWSMKDILYQMRNKGPTSPTIPPGLKDLHKASVPAEYRIYDHFKRKYLEMAEEAVDLNEEVAVFRSILLKTRNYCGTNSPSGLEIGVNKFDPGFTVSLTDCFLMGLNEGIFVGRLKKLQKP